VSALQVLRNYLNAIRKAGGTVVWTEEPLGRGTARLTAGGAETWVAIRAFDQGEGCELVVVEKQAMAQEVTAAEMLDALNRDGRIALSIQFDTGKATIKPESMPIIEQMTALLQGTPALNVSVEGHTDSVGSAAANQALSESRAQAVVAALVERGFPRDGCPRRGSARANLSPATTPKKAAPGTPRGVGEEVALRRRGQQGSSRSRQAPGISRFCLSSSHYTDRVGCAFPLTLTRSGASSRAMKST